MDINSAIQKQITSVKSALSMSTLQTAMSQDGATVSKLIEGMEETSEAMQKASLPHRGNYIDIRV